jgi:hypothetical protein
MFVPMAAGALLISSIAGPAAAVTVNWQTIVGIEQPGNVVGSFATPPTCPTNGAGCVNGGGQPWTTLPNITGSSQSQSQSQSQGQGQNQNQSQSHATVNAATVNLATGHLQFQVHGLVLAGGNSIGTVPSNITSIIGTLICIVTPSGPNVVINTSSVPLSSLGDAQFSGSVGSIPTPCNSSNIAFLIRTSPTGNWIANGSVRSAN